MRFSILVIYYSQSGQLRTILDTIVNPLRDVADINYAIIEPENTFPFPWTTATFFDCMPECVQEIPSTIKPMEIPNKKYDLVILGYQPWFLSPSIPTTSFLKSNYANVLKDVPVITVVGCRNMWLNAQERVKAALIHKQAPLAGNIVLCDTNHNIISLFTIIRWAFKGKKEATGMLPAAGVQQKDIEAASRFGTVILQALQQGNIYNVQEELLSLNAVQLKSVLIVLEKRGITNFRKFATYIRAKGERGNPARQPRVKFFSRLLITGIFVLSPFSWLTAKLASIVKQKTFKEQAEYLKGVSYRDNIF